MKDEEAYQFERTHRLHETRKAMGILNRLIPCQWRIYSDEKVNERTVNALAPLTHAFERPVVVAIGAGGGGLLRLIWNKPNIVRIGVDINHDVLVDEGKLYFHAVEGSACSLPLADDSVDVVLFDYVLHHLVGQDMMEDSIREGLRVVRPGGYIIAREPSAFSMSGLAMNMANKFRLMNRLTGASNYEFALSPPYLLKLFGQGSSIMAVHGLSYLWSRRLPIWLQDSISKLEPYVFRGQRGRWLADFILYIMRKEPRSVAGSRNGFGTL